MPRRSFDDEVKKRREADELIETYALQTNKLIYLSPAAVELEAARRGLEMDRQYLLRRYLEKGIVFENGLWFREL